MPGWHSVWVSCPGIMMAVMMMVVVMTMMMMMMVVVVVMISLLNVSRLL